MYAVELFDSYKIIREFKHADCVTEYKKLEVEMNTDSSDSVSEPVLDSDAEKEPKSDLKRGVESVFDSGPRAGFELFSSEMIRVSF